MTLPVDIGLIERLRDEAALCRSETAVDVAELLEEAADALTASEKRRRETDMLAYKWMVAHDRLAAGLQYEFPSPANIPDALARVNELETFVRSVQVPTKDGTWKEVMFRLADEARVILAKGERS